MAIERTFSIVKPDAVAKNLIGQIYNRFETARAIVAILWWGLKKLLWPFFMINKALIAFWKLAFKAFGSVLQFLKPIGSAIINFLLQPFYKLKGILGWLSDKIIGLAKKLGVHEEIKVGIKGVGDIPEVEQTSSKKLTTDQLAHSAVKSSGGGSVAYRNENNISIQTHQGMSPEEIAKAVTSEMDKRDRKNAARIRGTLHDGGTL